MIAGWWYALALIGVGVILVGLATLLNGLCDFTWWLARWIGDEPDVESVAAENARRELLRQTEQRNR